MEPLAPDALIDYLIESLALNGDDGAAIDDLWRWSAESLGNVDEFQKTIVWKWLMAEVDSVRAAIGDRLLDLKDMTGKSYKELEEEFGEKLRVYAKEELQWMHLTGKSKEGNALGDNPFQILCAVARSRERGLTTVELARETGQDPRSIGGRVSKLMDFGLVQRYPVVHDRMSTHLTVYRKYIKSNREAANARNSTGIDTNQLRREIVQAVKIGEQGKPGIRQHDDLKKQLQFDVTSRSHIIFSQCVRRLEAQGYVKRVISQPAGREERYRCIKFVADLPEDQDENSDDDFAVDLVDEMNNGGEDDQLDIDVQPNQVDMSAFSADDLIKVEEDTVKENKDILVSLFYPLEVQIYQLVNSFGVNGLSGMDLSKKLVGRPFSRIFARMLDSLVLKDKSKSKISVHLRHMNIVRGTDSYGRVKYYRYYTQRTFSQLRGLPFDPQWGTFGKSDTKGCFKNLAALEEKFASSMPGVIEVRKEGEKLLPLFHGDRRRTSESGVVIAGIGVPTSEVIVSAKKSTGKKRGRPRKRPLDESEETPVPKRRGRPRKSDVEARKKAEVEETNRQLSTPTKSAVSIANLAVSVGENIQHTVDVTAGESIIDGNSMGATLQLGSEPMQVDATGPLPAPSASASMLPTIDININPLVVSSIDQSMVDPEMIPQLDNSHVAPEILNQNLDRSNTAEILQHGEDTEELSERQRELNLQAQIALATPRYKRPSTKKQLVPTDGSLDLAGNKRATKVLECIAYYGGAVEAGLFTKQLNDFVNDSTTSDRRTIEKVVHDLIMSGKLRRITVTFPNARGIHITKSIYLQSGIDDDDEKVLTLKNEIERTIKKRVINLAVPKKIEIEENEVGFAFHDVHEKFVRGSIRRMPKKSAAEVRLKKADKVLSERSKGKVAKAKKSIPQAPISQDQDQEPSAKALNVSLEDDTTNVVPSRGRRPKKTNASGVKQLNQLKDPVASSNQNESAILSPTPSRKAKKQRVPKAPAKRDPVTGKIIRTRLRTYEEIDTDLFYRVVVIARCLFSSTMGVISWERVAQALSVFTGETPAPDVAKAKWPNVRDKFGGINQFARNSRRFEKIFLKAYANGAFPIAQSAEDYDIASYAAYWKTHDRELQEATTPWLARSRSAILEEYTIKSLPVNDSIEAINNATSMVKADEHATAHCFTFVHETACHQEERLEAAQRAIRSVIASSVDAHHMKESTTLLREQFGEELCTEAIAELEKDRSVSYGPKDRSNLGPGRNYIFSDRFNHALNTKYTPSILDDATNFEGELTSAINLNKGLLMSRTAPDSSMVCALDFVSNQSILLVRVNADHIAGVFGDGYRSRRVDKEKLDCDIVWRGRKGDKLLQANRQAVAVPLGDPCSTIWTNVSGELTVDLWQRVVLSILWIVSLRPGVTASTIQGRLKIVLTLKEVQLVLNWLSARENITKRSFEGYWINEQWYSNVFM